MVPRGSVRRRWGAVIIALLFVPAVSFAQDSAPAPPGTSAAPTAEVLRIDSLHKDLETADYYGLVAWCRSLGLSDAGTLETLRSRLYGYYGISPRTPDEAGPGSTIDVQRAANLEYGENQIGETVLELSGGVSILFRENGGERVHSIRADEISYNQDTGVVMARGNIEYRLEGADADESFEGDAMVMRIGTWAGEFFDGTTRQTSDDGNILTFRGERIRRAEDNQIWLEQGSITSSRADPPNFRIGAEDIHVMEPGEWGIRHAVLYIGRVPTLYFPYFYLPADDMVFHPSFGTDVVKGTYLQTTSYLVGDRRAVEDDDGFSLSFLQTAGASPLDYVRVRDGIFLRPTDEPRPVQENRLALTIDAYSRLGFLVGGFGEVYDAGVIEEGSVVFGVGVSRDIYAINPGGYSVYSASYPATGPSRWQGSYLGGVRLPFRYVLDLSTSLSGESWSAELALPVYSDSSFSEDFLSRSESVDWFGAVSGETGTASAPSLPLWRLGLDWRGRFEEHQASVDLELVQAFAEMNVVAADYPLILGSGVATPVVFPESSFYRPTETTMPSLKARLEGTIFDESYPKQESVAEASTDADSEFLAPWYVDPEEPPGLEDPNAEFAPPLFPDETFARLQIPDRYRHALSYRLTPRFGLSGLHDATDWTLPSDVEFGADTVYWDWGGNYSVTYQSWLLGDLLTAREVLTFDANQRDHFFISSEYSAAERAAFEENDDINTKFSVTQAFDIDSSAWDGALASLDLSYRLNQNLWTYVYDQTDDSFDTRPAEWNDLSITSHAFTAALGLFPQRPLTAGVTADLPPRDDNYTGYLRYVLGPSTSRFTYGYDNAVGWKDLVFSQTLDFGGFDANASLTWSDGDLVPSRLDGGLSYQSQSGDLRMNHATSWNLTDNEVITSVSSLSFLDLSASLTLDRSLSYTADSLQWIPSAEPSFGLSRATMAYNGEFEPAPAWKNRLEATARLGVTATADFRRYTDSVVRFDYSMNFLLHRFVTLNLKGSSINRRPWQYFGALTSPLGVETLNPFVDLGNSFAFLDPSKRRDSSFKLQSLGFDLVHDLGDWDLIVGYSGRYDLGTDELDRRQWEWSPEISVLLQWRAIPEVKKEFDYGDDGWVF